MRLSRLLLAVVVLLAPVLAHATAQEPDVLLLDGRQEPVFTNPLEPYLARHPALRPKPSHSANWRGYVATFAIRDGGLWLEKVEVDHRPGTVGGEHRRATVDVLPTFFPGKRHVLADWYSGVLLIPRGRLVEYVHMGYGSTYERYVLLEIRRGRLHARHDMTAKELDAHRRRMFEAYKRTPAYTRQLAESMKAGLGAKEAERFLFQFESADYLTRPLPPSP